jgi:hypothetical protein
MDAVATGEFPLTANDLGVKGDSDKIAYANFVYKMIQIMQLNPIRFSITNEDMIGEFGIENWSRHTGQSGFSFAIMVLVELPRSQQNRRKSRRFLRANLDF